MKTEETSSHQDESQAAEVAASYDTTATFVRPAWAMKPRELSDSPVWAMKPRGANDSTPRISTGELRRPALGPGDSIPRITTGELLRPRWIA